MTIEEKRQAIKEHCKTNEDCSYCDLYYIDKNCWHIANNGSDEDVEKIYNILNYGTADVTRNLAEVSDTFICKECGIHLEDCVKCVYDEDAEDTTHYEYEFKFCPECGRKIVEE